jgi:uncharacterized membrane protein/uncharacterized protein with PQ loop repeat
MHFPTLIGLLAAFCTTISYLPQLKKCWDTGSSGDLSFKMFSILAAGIALWIVYGWLQSDLVIIVANSTSLALLMGILWFKIRERRRRSAGELGARQTIHRFAEGNTIRPDEPTYPPPSTRGLASTLDRNIEALRQRRVREESTASWQERTADAITRFTGSMLFVYIHLAVFGFWIVANLHLISGVPAWDDSFVILAMIASVEAIFLSTFVLISQNRMATAADKRADLDLQISLLTEHELTKMATLMDDMTKKMGVKTRVEDELREIEQDVAPDAVLDEIEKKACC